MQPRVGHPPVSDGSINSAGPTTKIIKREGKKDKYNKKVSRKLDLNVYDENRAEEKYSISGTIFSLYIEKQVVLVFCHHIYISLILR